MAPPALAQESSDANPGRVILPEWVGADSPAVRGGPARATAARGYVSSLPALRKIVNVASVSGTATSVQSGELTVSGQILPASVNIGDAEFSVVQSGSEITLVHPKWSLVGIGSSLVQAIADLITEAKELRGVMAGDDPRTLSPEANSLRNFLFKLFE